MRDPRLLTVVLNWRTPDMTLRATRAVATAMSGLDGEIVVVDNDSGDGSEAALRTGVAEADWPVPVRVIQSGHNGGFGAGMNAGIRAGRADDQAPDYVYILNSDAFPAPNAVRILLDRLEGHPEAGIAGSYIHGPEGDPHITSFRFPSVASEFEGAARIGLISRVFARQRVPMDVPEATRRVDWLAGASMMMRRSVLDDVGLFDESFFLYYEETDLCRRVRAAGHEVHYVRESAVEHIGSVSTGMKTWSRVPDYWFASRWHYFETAGGRWHAAAATTAHLAGGVLHRLKQTIKRQPPADPPGFLRTLVRHDLRRLFRPGDTARPAARPQAAE
ncbi:N-acetylglucosaminyl-diphospho-decaprenol L-rhamnosyltransferase [Roseivivax jejudonensis]|uniref:N-acetylglucosaminyl-diphospho-decaprenol L-rhamnosyltransferase n=1 Tax=Roseivivax jejudonensis TaxID=1529041 RepID=A0A1X6YIT4_9RHOB|nr:glycosyltransferase family 2 protein [Roseivivax jejudonensis]SLN22502.1 N-acetylglucosaminyl-diphospho-decaprenol L-rhamnosyltransferase [Roseivivax jejudonensis]